VSEHRVRVNAVLVELERRATVIGGGRTIAALELTRGELA